MNRLLSALLLPALLLPAACGQPSSTRTENEAVQHGIDRSVADIEAAEAAASRPAT